MFKFIRRFFEFRKNSVVKNIYKEMDKDRKKNKEVWHYICINGHKWQSYNSPTGSYCSINYGMKETSCPECRTNICSGNIFINGKQTKMGAMHKAFIKK